jgi:hypothetical protein
MRKLIALVALAFALAASTSMMALTVRADRPHIDQDSPHTAAHHKTSLLY